MLTSKKNNSISKLFFQQIILLSVLLAFVISVHPINFYLNTSTNFSISLDLVFLRSIKFFFIVFLFSFFFLYILKKIVFATRLCSIFLTLTILLCLQGYVFLWSYGVIDGSYLDYSKNNFLGYLELLIWVVGIFISFKHSKIIFKYCNLVAILLGGVICSALIVGLINFSSYKPWYKSYNVDWTHLSRFSSQKNIIVLIIDSARGDIFSEILNELSVEDRNLLEGFTFFDDVSGSSINTISSVPAILNEKIWNRRNNFFEEYYKIFRSPNSVLHKLKNEGYVVDVYPYEVNSVSLAPDICSNLQKINLTKNDILNDFSKLEFASKFQFSPHIIKTLLFPSNSLKYMMIAKSKKNSKIHSNNLPSNILEHIRINFARLQVISSNAKFVEEPVFKYIHFHGAHHPYFHDEEFKAIALPETVESYKKQFKGSLFLTLSALKQTLKKKNVYDESMIIIAGDHGAHITNEQIKNKDSNSEFKYVSSMLNPMILVKPFNAPKNPIEINSAQASLFDIPATIFDALHYEYSGEYSPLFKIVQHKNRNRFVYIPYGTYSPYSGIDAVVKINGSINNLRDWEITGNCNGIYSDECNDIDVIRKKIKDWSQKYVDSRKQHSW